MKRLTFFHFSLSLPIYNLILNLLLRLMLGYSRFGLSMIFSDPVVSSSNCAIQFEYLVMIGQSGLSLVLWFLVGSPSCLSLTLLNGHLLVLLLNLLCICRFSHCIFIFKHAAHPQNGLLLSAIIFFFFIISSPLSSFFAHLLVGPVALVLSILLHSLIVYCSSTKKTYD